MGQAQGNVLKGVFLVTLATLVFAASDIVTKKLAMIHAVVLIVAVRYLVNIGLMAVLLGPREGKALWHTQRTGLVVLRGLCLAAASLTMGLALRTMPVAETVAIIYLSPFAVMLLASRLLGEKVTLAGWLGAVVGFAGVLLILRPGAGLDPVGISFALINAGFATAYHLLTRVLSRTETTTALLFHTAVWGLLVFLCLMPFTPGVKMPSVADLGWMALLGVLATAGHFLFTSAYREAPASVIAPVNYLHLVWAAVLGFVVFDHMPDQIGLIGMALVVAAGIWVALRAYPARRANVILKGESDATA